MQQDEEVTLDVVEENTNDTVTEEETPEVVETEEDALAKAQAEAAKYRRLFEKANKAPTQVQATPTIDPVEAALRVSGMSKEMLEQLKKVAAVTGQDLIDAQNDPIFVAVKEKFEKEQKHADASLPATRGSGAVKAKVTLDTPGLSRDQHKKLALEAFGS